LASAGARVALAARRLDRLEELRDELAADGAEVVAIPMDVTDEASTIGAYDAVVSAFGCVDTVIANAGVNVHGNVLDLDVAEFDHIVAANLRGVFLTLREGARRMVAAGSNQAHRGRMVIISSITATQVTQGLAAYSATKAAVVQMGRVLAKDWADLGINVNIIAPGYMLTDLTEQTFSSDRGRAIIEGFPRRRLLDADALDTMLLYLCSDASRQVTGTVVTIDDGQTL
jgi:NAD(P)-dependent dehydrogenase (short-subunit alcohol dehydrogenase family)